MRTPSSLETIRSTSSYGNGSIWSCSRSRASRYGPGRRSARVENSWPSLMNVGPSRSRSLASSSAGAAAPASSAISSGRTLSSRPAGLIRSERPYLIRSLATSVYRLSRSGFSETAMVRLFHPFVSLPCRCGAIDCLTKTLGAESSELHSVYKDRGRDADSVHLAFFDVALDFSLIHAPVQRHVELCAVQPKLGRVFFQRRDIKRVLSFIEKRDVFKKLALCIRRVRRFRCFASVLVTVQRKVSDDESNLVAVGL